jgi:hypothetical protein
VAMTAHVATTLTFYKKHPKNIVTFYILKR